MALLIGQPINARQLEQATGSWSAENSASMCNSLIWAISGEKYKSLPSFVMRQVRDGGVDAEWDVELPDDKSSIPTPFLLPGWNVFQFKKSDIMARDRKRIISDLKSQLKGAVNNVTQKDKEKRTLNHYILFVNIDIKGSEKAEIKKKLLNQYSDRSKLKINIVDAEEIAAMLNNHPHLREAYFKPLAFKTWEKAFQDHAKHTFLISDVDMIGRESEISQLKSLIDDSRTRIIILSGPHHIGKSRLAIEATRDRPHNVVMALDPRSMNLNDYRYLCPDRGKVICIVEDPEQTSLEDLIRETLSLSNLKLIITLPTSANNPAPLYGYNESVQSINLAPLSNGDAVKLLKAANKNLSFEIEDWIISHAGGNPGTLLIAAKAGNELRNNLTDFTSTIGSKFERRIKFELGSDALKCIRLFSLLTHVGVSEAFESELKQITEVFGDGWQPHNALLLLPELEKTGLVRRGGSFVELTLPILANYLLEQLLKGQTNELFALFGRLGESGQYRFIKRIGEIKGEEVNHFWEEMFSRDGLLGSFKSALANAYIMRLVVCTVPERVLKILETGLQSLSVKEKTAIEGEKRRELMWMIEQLLFRTKTSKSAVRLLLLLAEAENENFSNNATGVFSECFHVSQPQLPLSFSDRLDLLRECISNKASNEIKLISAKAIGGSLSVMGGCFRLRRSEGPTPLDKPVSYTDKEFYDYAREVTDILFNLLNDKDNEVASAALKQLPELIADLATQARPADGMERFKRIVDMTIAGNSEIYVDSLFNNIRIMYDWFLKVAAKEETPTERKNEYQQYLLELDEIKNRLENSGFSVRLKRWVGPWIYEDRINMDGQDGRNRLENEVKKLVKEVIEKPDILNSELTNWLLSSSAQKSHYFFNFLGKADLNLIYRNKMEELGQSEKGANAFSLYWGGWAHRDKKSAEEYMEQLSKSNKVTGSAIAWATLQEKISEAAINRIESQIKKGHVEPKIVATSLTYSWWLKEIKEDQFERLLTILAGQNFEHSGLLIDIFSSWLHESRNLKGSLGEIAWRCLEKLTENDLQIELYHADKIAAKLSQDNEERGFKLFEKLVQVNENNCDSWNPIDRFSITKFWNILFERDKKRLIKLLLSVAKKDKLELYKISWDLRNLNDLFNKEEYQDLLLSLAVESIDNARVIAGWVTSANKCFWPIFSEMVKKYPNDEKLFNNLISGIRQDGKVIMGSLSNFYENRKKEVEKILNESSTPSQVKSVLTEIIDRLEGQISQNIIWEYDEDVNDLRRFINDKNSTQRIWAIGRLLKYADWKDIRRLLRVEDIVEALPQIDLPDKKRKMYEQLTKEWAYG